MNSMMKDNDEQLNDEGVLSIWMIDPFSGLGNEFSLAQNLGCNNNIFTTSLNIAG